MENNEDNVQVVQNVQNQEKKKKKRGVPISIFVCILIIVSLFCICIGILIGTNDELFKKIGTQVKKSEELTVTNIVSSEKNGKQLLIEGKDKDGKTVWTYTTPSENIPQQITNEGIKLIETRKGKVYLCDWGKLYILDEQTGDVLAKNTEVNIGAARAYTFDDDDNLYTVSYLSALNKFDSNGKLIKSTSDVWNEGFAWPKSMNINGNDLKVEFEEGTATISKETFSITNTNKITKVTPTDTQKTTELQETPKVETPKTANNNNTNTASGYVQEYIKIIEQVKANHKGSALKCDLIYFNNDNIPDLVIGGDGYWVSVYMYENGTVYNPVEEWPYGAMGNTGYDYLEKKGLIFNHNSDYAGAISTDSVLILNSAKGFDVLSYTGRGANIDSTDPELADLRNKVDDELKQSGGYYYNSTKISKNEYDNKLRAVSINSVNDANWKVLCGTKSADELLNQMQ